MQSTPFYNNNNNNNNNNNSNNNKNNRAFEDFGFVNFSVYK